MEFDAKSFVFSEGTYAAEISELSHQYDIPVFGRTPLIYDLTLVNCPDQGLRTVFEDAGVDKDASGEDIYGWRWKQKGVTENPLQVLIIND